MAKGAPPTTDRSTYQWSEKETAFLTANATTPRGKLVPAFRSAFPKATMSDTAILGKRYHLVSGTGVAGLESKVRNLEVRLEAARADLKAAEDRASAKLVRETQDAVYEGFPRPPTAAQAAILKGAAKAPVAKKAAKKPAGKGARITKPRNGKVKVVTPTS